MSDPRIVLVTRKTRLQELVEKYNTQGQAKFYIEHLGQDFSDYLTEHDNYRRIQDSILRNLASSVNWIQVERSFLSTFVFSPSDIVYVLGQDGLVCQHHQVPEGSACYRDQSRPPEVGRPPPSLHSRQGGIPLPGSAYRPPQRGRQSPWGR